MLSYLLDAAKLLFEQHKSPNNNDTEATPNPKLSTENIFIWYTLSAIWPSLYEVNPFSPAYSLFRRFSSLISAFPVSIYCTFSFYDI